MEYNSDDQFPQAVQRLAREKKATSEKISQSLTDSVENGEDLFSHHPFPSFQRLSRLRELLATQATGNGIFIMQSNSKGDIIHG